MKTLILIFIALASLLSIPQVARACTCADYHVPVCAAYWQADAVFAGQLLDITPVKEKDDQPPTVMLHFIVEQPFRGVAGNRVDVETLHGTSCDMTFKKGKRYLIYASREADGLFAHPCSRTTELKTAVDDLNYIRTVTQQQAKETILGRLASNKYDPLSGIKVTVQSGDKTWESKTDEKGNFSVPVPGPGKYAVRTFIPFAADVMTYQGDAQVKTEATDTLTTFEYEVEVGKSECQYRFLDTFKIDLHATAEISGSVLNASGQPVNPGHVYLVNAADPNRREFKMLEDNGSFKFEGIAPGEYYVVLNPDNDAPDEDDAPYPRTYFPNASEESGATKIVVAEGAVLENLTLRVGPRWKEWTVSGNVVWQNGRSAKDAHVSLYDGDRYVRMIKVDEKGKFNFQVYGDFKYEIVAEVWSGGKSERVAITNEKSTGLRLVLKREE